MSVIKCKPYGAGQPIYIVASKIVNWSWQQQDQRTYITTTLGVIAVGDYADDVADLVRAALKEGA